MPDPAWLDRHARLSLRRLLPRLAERFARAAGADAWEVFTRRLAAQFPRLFRCLHAVYGDQYDFFFHLENILATAAQAWLERPAELRALDEAREADPHWFQSNAMLGGVCYVDLYAGTLRGLREKIPYFKELGLTYLHLMPLFKAPEGNSDGGYAVSSYREINPALGSIDELRDLSAELRRHGPSLVVDFIFNHTSDEHAWAQAARAGDEEYQNYYLLFPDRTLPDAYERTLREIFPDEHPGAFSFDPRLNQWVWTTFHTFQWDLNYSNPAVFAAMAGELLFLANAGVEVLRLDAVAFIWKQMGTSCENLPQAHQLIQAFNALCRIAAPALLFKSEAIVHPDEVARYIHPDECQLSYNPLLMALLWNSLATRKVRLLSQAMDRRFALPAGCAWVNYVRVHDDIGWTFSDEDAATLGVKGYDHRQFLNQFFTGRFPGSFARGLPFQENPKTGDMRISGTAASLAGLELALADGDPDAIETALQRLLLIHSVIVSIGGIPLLYLGDELGQLNDYGYRADPAKHDDSRWVHRPAMDWARAERRHDSATVEGRLYQRLAHLIALRREHPVFAGGTLRVAETRSDHVFGYERAHGGQRLLALANFSDHEQPAYLGLAWGGPLRDLVTGETLTHQGALRLRPYEFRWLVEAEEH